MTTTRIRGDIAEPNIRLRADPKRRAIICMAHKASNNEMCYTRCGLSCASECDRFPSKVCRGCPCRAGYDRDSLQGITDTWPEIFAVLSKESVAPKGALLETEDSNGQACEEALAIWKAQGQVPKSTFVSKRHSVRG